MGVVACACSRIAIGGAIAVGALCGHGCAAPNPVILETSPQFYPTAEGGYWDERGLYLQLFWFENEDGVGGPEYELHGSVTSVNRAEIHVAVVSFSVDGLLADIPATATEIETHRLDGGDEAIIERFVCTPDAAFMARLANASDLGAQAVGAAGETPMWYFNNAAKKGLRSIYRASMR